MKIIWLAGYPKSGTTWLRAFLSAYTYGKLDINDMSGFGLDDLNPAMWQSVSMIPTNKLTTFDLAPLRGAALFAILKAQAGRATIRTHSIVGTVNGYPLIPECLTDKAVQIVRDPRDIAVSMVHYLNCSQEHAVGALAESSMQVKEQGLFWMLGNWSEHVMSWVDAPWNTLTVRYEDMLAAPSEAFTKIVEFLGMTVNRGNFDTALGLTDFQRMQAQENKDGFSEMLTPGKFFRCGKAGSWKDELKPELAERIESQHGKVMERFGYEIERK